MQEKIHLSHCSIGNILLLSEDGTTTSGIILHVVDSLNQHTTRTTSRIIYCFTWLRVENTNQQSDYRTRCIELTCFGFREVCKFLQQHFVGITHQVSSIVAITQTTFTHMLYQVAQFLVAKHILVTPVSSREYTQYAIKSHGVCQLNLAHCSDDGTTNVGSALAHIFPMTTFGYHKAMLLWK